MKKEERYKQLYECLLASGEIRGLKKYKGDWEKDKKQFIRDQSDLENLANYIDVEE